MNFRKTTKTAAAPNRRAKSDVRELSVRELPAEEQRLVSGGATSTAPLYTACCTGKHISQGKVTI